MKTLDRIVKHYDETSMLMEDYQTQFFEYLLEKKGRVFDYLRWFCWTSFQKSLRVQSFI